MNRSISVACEPDIDFSMDTLRDLEQTLDRAADRIEREQSREFGQVTLLIVSEARICALHDAYFGDPASTDVITFPDALESCPGVIHGDIAICLDVIREQASQFGNTTEEELAYIGIHGLLHLAGWSDATVEQRRAMLRRQDELLRSVLDNND